MKILLCKSIEKLGIVGDVVDVKPGYARNYLLPHHLATEPTETNMRSLAEARRVAEEEREKKHAELVALAEKIEGVEVTIHARANEDGVLYGSVGVRDVSDALAEEGFFIKPEQILLERPIRQLDNLLVELKLGDDLRSAIKVWVVRDKSEDDDGDGTETSDGTESSDRTESDGESDEPNTVGTEAGENDNSGDE